MTFVDKLNILTAKTAKMVNSAVESGKLSMKIDGEEKKIKEATNQICKLVIEKLDADDEMSADIMDLYTVIKVARRELDAAKEERDAFRSTEDITCPSCKTKNTRGTSFCGSCSAKLEA